MTFYWFVADKNVTQRKSPRLLLKDSPTISSPKTTESPQKIRKPNNPKTNKELTAPKKIEIQEEEPSKKRVFYRSNLTTIYNLFSKINVSRNRKQALKLTPFYNLVKPFIEKEVNLNFLTKNEASIMSILHTFQPLSNGFRIGPDDIVPNKRDIELVYGIVGGSSEIVISNTKRSRQGIGALLIDFTQISYHHLNSLLLNLLKEEDSEQNAIVFAKLISLMLLAALFIPSTSQYVPWGWVKYVDDLNDMKSWDWAGAILSDLRTCLHAMQSDVSTCKGLVSFLPYLVCEHTNIFKPSVPNAFPRFLKWNLTELKRKFCIRSLPKLTKKEAFPEMLKLTKQEWKIYRGEEEQRKIEKEEKRSNKRKTIEVCEKDEREEEENEQKKNKKDKDEGEYCASSEGEDDEYEKQEENKTKDKHMKHVADNSMTEPSSTNEITMVEIQVLKEELHRKDDQIKELETRLKFMESFFSKIENTNLHAPIVEKGCVGEEDQDTTTNFKDGPSDEVDVVELNTTNEEIVENDEHIKGGVDGIDERQKNKEKIINLTTENSKVKRIKTKPRVLTEKGAVYKENKKEKNVQGKMKPKPQSDIPTFDLGLSPISPSVLENDIINEKEKHMEVKFVKPITMLKDMFPPDNKMCSLLKKKDKQFLINWQQSVKGKDAKIWSLQVEHRKIDLYLKHISPIWTDEFTSSEVMLSFN